MEANGQITLRRSETSFENGDQNGKLNVVELLGNQLGQPRFKQEEVEECCGGGFCGSQST